MDSIIIRGLRVMARHGLLEWERSQPQPFAADIVIQLDMRGIVNTDSINDTINYADVCSLARDFLQNSPLNLIEALAEGLATGLLARFERARAVTVTLHKPQAPVDGEWDDIAVEIKRGREDFGL